MDSSLIICNTKKVGWLLLLLLLPLPYLQAAEPDSVLIRTFTGSNYKASTLNYTGIEGPDGILYFANENGVLEYDGSQWNLIPINNFSAAVSVAYANGKIYVGGRDEFGYLAKDSLGKYEYVSLRSLLSLKEGELLKEIWQIVAIGKNVYFGSLEMVLRYDGKAVHKIPIKGSYIFRIGEHLYTSALQNQGLARIINDSVQVVNAAFSFKTDAAFQHMKGLQGEHMILTADNGVYLLDTATFITKKWPAKVNSLLAKSSLYNAVIWQDSLYAFSTYLGGLFVVDKQGKLLHTYNKDNGMYGNTLRELFKDSRGNLWITSDYGLRYLQRQSRQEGIGGYNTIIRHISIGELEMLPVGQEPSIATPADYAGSIVFNFATPGYHAEELEYSYFLKGFDKGWSAWKSDVRKEYTNLRGGDYTFYVKARDRQGIETRPASIDLTVPQSWYKTTAAYIFFFVILGAITGYAIHYRTKKLTRLNKRLANIISKRTKELVEQREQLRATNNELRVRNTELDNFVYRSSHDLVAPLKSLKGLIHITQNEQLPENRAIYFKLMHTSIEKLEEFIKSIMEYSSNAKKDIMRVPIELDGIIESIVQDLKYYDKADRIELVRKIDPEAVFYSDPKRLKIILSNLITNSIKYHNYYQDYLFIEVKAVKGEDEVKICVSDNGRGIENEYQGKIFDMFFRATDTAQGSGLGLYIVKDTVEKLGGRIIVSSEIGKGSVFTLSFPCIQPTQTTVKNDAGQQLV